MGTEGTVLSSDSSPESSQSGFISLMQQSSLSTTCPGDLAHCSDGPQVENSPVILDTLIRIFVGQANEF
jgi:hypothetical protein